MHLYRLRARRAVGADHIFDRTFATPEEAYGFGVANLDVLAAHGAWRVRSFEVLELPSWRVMPDMTVYWHDPEFDPDPFESLPASEPPGGTPPSVLDTWADGVGGMPRDGVQPRVPSQDAASRPGGRPDQ